MDSVNDFVRKWKKKKREREDIYILSEWVKLR